MVMKLLSHIWQTAAKLNDKLWYKGCNFAGWVSTKELGIDENMGNQYQPSTNAISAILNHFNVTPNDAFIDIGCGKGKVMYLASKYPFKKVSGFDLNEQMVATANRNFEILKLKGCYAVVANALTFDAYDDYNYFYVFNPFPEAVFEKMIYQIQNSIRKMPRKCTFIYMNPVYEELLLKKSDFKECYSKKSLIPWFNCKCYQN